MGTGQLWAPELSRMLFGSKLGMALMKLTHVPLVTLQSVSRCLPSVRQPLTVFR
jgi:hypothetical protein